MAVEDSTTHPVQDLAHLVNDERYRIQHAAALLLMLGDDIGTPFSGRSDLEQQELGARVEYLAEQIEAHCKALGAGLEALIEAAQRRPRDAGEA